MRLATFTVLLLLFTSCARADVRFTDPRNRFELQVPAGWQSTQLNADAVQFSIGSTFVTVFTFSGADPEAMLNAISTQSARQWRNLKEESRGPAEFGGRPGISVRFSGIAPNGNDSFLQLVASGDGNHSVILMSSVPRTESDAIKSSLDTLQASFRFSNAVEVPAIKARTTAAAGGAGSYLVMKKVRVVDQSGFERPMTAATLLIPADWQLQSDIQYQQAEGCPANLVKLVFRASSPDGKLAVELLPGNTWQWTDDQFMRNYMMQSNQMYARFGGRGCDVMQPMTSEAYLRQFVIPNFRRGGRIVAAEPMADAQQKLRADAQRMEQESLRSGVRVTARTDAARVRLAADDFEEWVMAFTGSVAAPGPSFNVMTGGMGQTLYYTNAADHVLAMRAPAGELDAQEPLFRLIIGSLQADPAWEGAVQRVIAQMQAKDSQAARQRSDIITDNSRQIGDMISNTYQNRQAAQDRSSANFSQYLRGTQTYRNPNTGEAVDLNNGYSHAWAGPDNTYILSNSANFNPNSVLGGNYTQLQSVR
jgi:hypothetical protein